MTDRDLFFIVAVVILACAAFYQEQRKREALRKINHSDKSGETAYLRGFKDGVASMVAVPLEMPIRTPDVQTLRDWSRRDDNASHILLQDDAERISSPVSNADKEIQR